ncbi:MAG: TolC family protein, partial [Gemmatimonadota bacterium]|nr:TolC family protein [Gemmatimonadota bacterium]
ARRVSDERVAAGDVSGYANRRIRIEAARYAVLRTEALLAQGSARRTLAALVAPSDGVLGAADALALTDTSDATGVPAAGAPAPVDSLVALALVQRGELAAIRLDAQAAQADATLVARERWPTPVLSGGIKTEEQTGIGGFRGLAVGIALPLPLWDRRGGAVEAAGAEWRRAEASVALARRRIEVEVRDAAASLRVVDEQLTVLRPVLGAESALALRAAEVAYAEGEIALVEWLDAVRAYHEAESGFATLRSELLIRRAALERAVGLPLRRSAP